MATNRRDLLAAGSALIAGVSLSGCLDSTLSQSADGGTTTTGDDAADADAPDPAAFAVAAEWNVYRNLAADALGLGLAGAFDAAETTAADAFGKFEKATGEWGAHEVLESTSETDYEEFEEAIGQLREHASQRNVSEMRVESGLVADHLGAAQAALVGDANARALDLQLFGARLSTASALYAVGGHDAAATIAGDVMDAFEGSEAHEKLESADSEAYETFEDAVKSVERAAGDGEGGTVRAKANDAFDAAMAGSYAVAADRRAAGAGHVVALQARGYDAVAVGELDDSDDAAAVAGAAVVGDAFAHFEDAEVHELLEESSRDAYEAFEATLGDFKGALADRSGVSDALSAFARASLRAEFAVAGAPGKAPVGEAASERGPSKDLSGGPNVVDGVPDDADHVVTIRAVSFDPAELTVDAGDTVAFEHAGGEAHTVTADADGLPDGADYWASGEFDSEDAAEAGWENGEGAVQSGQSYVHTFETTGTHHYFCIPHEAAGMTGKIVVE